MDSAKRVVSGTWGEVWLDGELVRKDGLYVPKELQCLNPDQYFAD